MPQLGGRRLAPAASQVGRVCYAVGPGSRRWNRVGTRADKTRVCGIGVRGGCGKVVSKGKDM